MSADHNIVSVSGGKDSTAMLLLAIERGAENLQAVFADTINGNARDLASISHETHGIWSVIEWSKTARGGRQFDLLRAYNDNLPLCSSQYGLCE